MPRPLLPVVEEGPSMPLKKKHGLSRTRSAPRRPFWYVTTLLAMEAQEVIFLRMLKLAAGGPQAASEASRMITEKAAAGAAAATALFSGGSPHRITADYRRKVKANARRLRK
jgi:hypothetical protein